jgi:prepilin-type processing-associated H-X9-DG protein
MRAKFFIFAAMLLLAGCATNRQTAHVFRSGDNYGTAGANFVFCDGHAQWIPRKNYMADFVLGTDEYHLPIAP